MKIKDNTEIIKVRVKDKSELVPMRERGAVSIPVYHGIYEVTPNASAEVELNTAGKKLERNIVVDVIPYAEVQNPNGTTIIIGE